MAQRLLIGIEPTKLCNLRCVNCLRHDTSGREEISIDLLARIFEQARGLGAAALVAQVDAAGDHAGPGGLLLGLYLTDNALGDNSPVTGSIVDPVAVVLPTSAVPTLSEWGMIIFMTIIMGLGVVTLLRRRME